MFILSFFYKIQFLLKANEEFVTAISGLYGCGVHLVTIAQHHTMEASTNHARYRNSGRIAQCGIQQTFLVGVFHACCDVGPIIRAICSHQRRGFYLYKRIMQRYIASAS